MKDKLVIFFGAISLLAASNCLAAPSLQANMVCSGNAKLFTTSPCGTLPQLNNTQSEYIVVYKNIGVHAGCLATGGVCEAWEYIKPGDTYTMHLCGNTPQDIRVSGANWLHHESIDMQVISVETVNSNYCNNDDFSGMIG